MNNCVSNLWFLFLIRTKEAVFNFTFNIGFSVQSHRGMLEPVPAVIWQKTGREVLSQTKGTV